MVYSSVPTHLFANAFCGIPEVYWIFTTPKISAVSINAILIALAHTSEIVFMTHMWCKFKAKFLQQATSQSQSGSVWFLFDTAVKLHVLKHFA